MTGAKGPTGSKVKKVPRQRPDWEPKIVVFCCNWCSYAGADLAGVSRMQYPANVRIVRVMCSARIDPIFLLDVLNKGVDGVLVTGCHIGDCHYVSGNLTAERRVNDAIRAIDSIGLKGRARLEWVSASEGQRFANLMDEFTVQIRELGPSPLRKGKKKRPKKGRRKRRR
jgi:F420-non-reducing hydrogenase iron-sulfur subunit